MLGELKPKGPKGRAYRGFLRKGPVTGYGGIGSSLKVLKDNFGVPLTSGAWDEVVGSFGTGHTAQSYFVLISTWWRSECGVDVSLIQSTKAPP